jgi:two-component system, LytTR family, sensor kinase
MHLAEVSQNRHYQFWTLQLIGWTGWVSLFALRDAYWGQPTDRILLLCVDAFAGLVLTTILRYIYQFVWERPAYVRVLTILIASYLIGGVWQAIKNFSQFYYYDEFRAVEEYGLLAYFNGIVGFSYTLFLGWSGLYFGLKYYRLLQEEQEKSIRAESLAHESQLRMLRYQLNPHFLFNTLNAISTLILDKDTDTANAMVSKLSNFLRYSLDKDAMQKVDLEHEINTMQLYLEIEKVRFDDRLKVEIDIEGDARKGLVPSLILQPLVENSIKYAVANREGGGKIRIHGKVFAGDLLLEVVDDGPGIETDGGKLPEFTGVGLANTKERLMELYGGRHSCKFGSALPHGLKIEVRIPFETE